MTHKYKAHRVPYDDSYGTCDRTLAKLLIYSGERSPDFVTAHLGIEPTHVVRVGERTINPRNGRTRVGSLNGWFLSSEGVVHSLDLRRHLDWLFSFLTPKKQAIKDLQSMDGLRMNVTCIWWSKANTGGPTLWPEHMSTMANLNLECGFEFAFFGDDPLAGR